MKKYLLISEVADILGISQSSLRQLEKSKSNLKIKKIRGRRYYEYKDLTKIADLLKIDFSPQIIYASKTYINELSTLKIQLREAKTRLHNLLA